MFVTALGSTSIHKTFFKTQTQFTNLILGDLKMKSILTITAVVLGLALTSGVAQANSLENHDGVGIHYNP